MVKYCYNCNKNQCNIDEDYFIAIIDYQRKRLWETNKQKRFSCYAAIAKELGYRQRQPFSTKVMSLPWTITIVAHIYFTI
jgi:hypothetical protein